MLKRSEGANRKPPVFNLKVLTCSNSIPVSAELPIHRSMVTILEFNNLVFKPERRLLRTCTVPALLVDGANGGADVVGETSNGKAKTDKSIVIFILTPKLRLFFRQGQKNGVYKPDIGH